MYIYAYRYIKIHIYICVYIYICIYMNVLYTAQASSKVLIPERRMQVRDEGDRGRQDPRVPRRARGCPETLIPSADSCQIVNSAPKSADNLPKNKPSSLTPDPEIAGDAVCRGAQRQDGAA